MHKELVRPYLLSTIMALESAGNNKQMAWDAIMRGADLLGKDAETSSSVLISLLSDNDKRIPPLAMLYLAMMHDIRKADNEAAVEPIRELQHNSQAELVRLSAPVILAILGDTEALQNVAAVMAEEGVSTMKDVMRQQIALIAYSIAENKGL